MGWIILFVAVGAIAWWIATNSESLKPKGDKTPPKTASNVAVNKSSVRSSRAGLNAIDDPWLEHCLAIEAAWDSGNYDWARQQLQRIAYGMVEPSVTDAQRADFTRLMTAFAKEDPLYKEVMERVRPMLLANPGMLQSQIYKGQPDDIKEQMRYVLYFANELGHINRVKKGNSYKLTLPDDMNKIESVV